MNGVGRNFALVAAIAVCVWLPGSVSGASAVHCEVDELKALEAAGRKADAEYKKLEQDYTNADAQARKLIAVQKAAIDELKCKQDSVLDAEQLRRLLKACRPSKQ